MGLIFVLFIYFSIVFGGKCLPTANENNWKAFYNVSFHQINYMNELNTTDLNDCYVECRLMSECVGFSRKFGQKTCTFASTEDDLETQLIREKKSVFYSFLKRSSYGHETKDNFNGNEGIVDFIKKGNGEYKWNTFRRIQPTSLQPLHSISNVQSPYQCQSFCNNFPSCLSTYHNERINSCHLLPTSGQFIKLKKGSLSDIYSEFSSEPHKHHRRWREYHRFEAPSNKIFQKKKTNVHECKQLCLIEKECHGIGYNFNTSICSLSSMNSIEGRLLPKSGVNVSFFDRIFSRSSDLSSRKLLISNDELIEQNKFLRALFKEEKEKSENEKYEVTEEIEEVEHQALKSQQEEISKTNEQIVKLTKVLRKYMNEIENSKEKKVVSNELHVLERYSKDHLGGKHINGTYHVKQYNIDMKQITTRIQLIMERFSSKFERRLALMEERFIEKLTEKEDNFIKREIEEFEENLLKKTKKIIRKENSKTIDSSELKMELIGIKGNINKMMESLQQIPQTIYHNFKSEQIELKRQKVNKKLSFKILHGRIPVQRNHVDNGTNLPFGKVKELCKDNYPNCTGFTYNMKNHSFEIFNGISLNLMENASTDILFYAYEKKETPTNSYENVKWQRFDRSCLQQQFVSNRFIGKFGECHSSCTIPQCNSFSYDRTRSMCELGKVPGDGHIQTFEKVLIPHGTFQHYHLV
ncbi:hypothetical protein SNEBB_000865 [Seison nebaliae]|nr:hypothetical protein SNEBB_000865 [Seison nebaliae]